MTKRRLKSLIRDSLRSKFSSYLYGYIPKRFSDIKNCRTLTEFKKASLIANKFIKLHDARYNDFLAGSALVGVLVPVIKGIIITGATSAATNIITDLGRTIITDVMKFAAYGDRNTSATGRLYNAIETNVNKLTNILSREDPKSAMKLKQASIRMKGLK